MEMSPDQAAPKHSGQQIGCQNQGGVQEPEQELRCSSQLCAHAAELLQADLWSPSGPLGRRIHAEGLWRTAFVLLLLPV